MTVRASLRARLEACGRSADEIALARLETHAGLIAEWNHSAGLVSRRDASEAGLLPHYAVSILALPWLEGRRRVVDVGSGGGFPVLVWAALRPDLEAVAVESNRRKAAFLRQAAHEMGLEGVSVLDRHLDDAGDLAARGADILSSRAAGCADLLLAAARAAPARVILFPGLAEASWLRACPPPGFALTHHEEEIPPGGGPPRVLVVLDPEVPRGTSRSESRFSS